MHGDVCHSENDIFQKSDSWQLEKPCFSRQVQSEYTPDFRLFAIHLMKFFSGKTGRVERIYRYTYYIIMTFHIIEITFESNAVV